MTTVLGRVQHERQLGISYGTLTAHQPLLGIVWQYGAWWDAPDTPEQDEALSQMALYVLDYCTACGLNVDDVWDSVEPAGVDVFIDRIIGRMARAYLNKSDNETKVWTAYLLHELALMAGSTKRFHELVAAAWDEPEYEVQVEV